MKYEVGLNGAEGGWNGGGGVEWVGSHLPVGEAKRKNYLKVVKICGVGSTSSGAGGF